MMLQGPGCDVEEVQISVREPVSFSPNPFSSYTNFTIYVETSHPAFSVSRSAARRRFSEFRWLRRQLWRHHPHRKPPELPPAGVLKWNKFDDAFLEERRAGLQTFLREVVCVPTYLGERVLHLFLQTELSIKDIEANLMGLRDDSVSELCRYWPIAPVGQEVEVSSPRDITVPSTPPRTLMTSCSVTSDTSSLGWSPPSNVANWLQPKSPSGGGLSSSLIC
ncbi:hypothetical protein B566_EDAN012457 [Ephemera danica]|nr:hypothetical protein B566_EDAN012457 [Ephemera danica]